MHNPLFTERSSGGSIRKEVAATTAREGYSKTANAATDSDEEEAFGEQRQEAREERDQEETGGSSAKQSSSEVIPPWDTVKDDIAAALKKQRIRPEICQNALQRRVFEVAR